ncbi:MAG: sensor histidine kinase [Niabella sp.]
MNQKANNKLRKTAFIFSLLFIYIVAALVWWFISLEKQNDVMLNFKLHQIQINQKNSTELWAPQLEKDKALNEHRRNRVKYAGEGIVFLGLMLVGAFYIYRSIKKQMLMQQQQQNLMMAVTHELKTPIAIAKLNVETLLKHRLDGAKQEKIIQMTLEELKRLDFLTNNILISSQLESSNHQLNNDDLNFSNLLKDRVAEFRGRFPDKIFLEEITEDAEVFGDALLLQILVNNLMENAVKYSNKNSTIYIKLQKNNKNVSLYISDEGIGVPDDEKLNIFNKFYRVGNEATRKAKGSGLGLYLCKKIAKDHNADIYVTNNEPKGSTFVVKFKRKG